MQDNLNNGTNKIIKLDLQKVKSFSFKKTVSACENKNLIEERNIKAKEEEIKENSKDEEKGEFNTGRWEYDEHKKFIEAIIKYGNDWKLVQKHISTRSSAQARSHAQKFFMKIKRSNILEKDFDYSKNSIKCLKDVISKMNTDQYLKTIKALNLIVFDKKNKKVLSKLKRQEKKIVSLNEGGRKRISKAAHSQIKEEPDKEKKMPRIDIISMTSSENNVSTKVKRSFDENEKCFELNFFNSFNSNMKREEYFMNEEEEKTGIFFHNSELFSYNQVKNDMKLSMEADNCMMFTDLN